MMVEVIQIRNVLVQSVLIVCGIVTVSAVSSVYRLDAEKTVLEEVNKQLRVEVEAYEAVINDASSNNVYSSDSGNYEKVAHLGTFDITYYCACDRCCGGNGVDSVGVTKSGVMAQEGVTIGVDPKVIPLGSVIYINGLGFRIAQDTGSAIKGNKIDVYVESHEKALKLGRHTAEVYSIGGAK